MDISEERKESEGFCFWLMNEKWKETEGQRKARKKRCALGRGKFRVCCST